MATVTSINNSWSTFVNGESNTNYKIQARLLHYIKFNYP